MIISRNRKARRGAHTVEFAVVIPVFFLLIFGLVEISRGMMVRSLVTNAARSGCRTGTLPGMTNTDVTNSVDSVLSTGGITGYTTTILVNGNSGSVATAATSDTITVQVSVPAANTSWLPTLSFLKNNIAGQFSMPHE